MRGKKKTPENQQIAYLVRIKDVEALEAIICDPHAKGVECRIATEGLIELNSPASWETIGRVVLESQRGLGELLISQFEEMEGSGVIRALGECLSNPDVFIRSAAVRALSKRPPAITMPHLLRASRDPESNLARMASRVILRSVERHTGILAQVPERTVEGILDLMDDRWAMELLSPAFPSNIRKLAARRLSVIGGEEASQALVSMVKSDTVKDDLLECCWSALENCRSVSDFILLPLLVSPGSDVKARALTVYARCSDLNAVDLIAGLAKDDAPAVRLAAITALRQLSDVGAIPALEVALDDPDESVSTRAIELLCTIDDSSPELVRAVSMQTGEVRRMALITLAKREINTDDLIDPYIEFLYKGSACTDLSQREYLDSLAIVAKTLGQACHPDGMLALTALARSVIRRMRRAAIQGLMMYPAADRADALNSIVDTHDPDIVKNVAFGLHDSRDERAILPLVRASNECRGKPMVRAKEALKEYPQARDAVFLIECLASKWASIRRYGAEQLKDLKDPKSIPALLEASQDKDVEVQLAVFEAMGPFASENEDVINRMLESVAYGDISVRQATCEALGEARCEAAVPDLIKALHNFFLRPRASDALRRIGNRKGFLAIKRLQIREQLFCKRPGK